AVNGLGGFHLAALASDEAAVAALRFRKHREDKPCALMAADAGVAAGLCRLSPEDLDLLQSRPRPVVLAPRRAGAHEAPSVAPGNRCLFDIDPEVVVHDLHPEYLSTKYALGLDGVELRAVQHHHAQVAWCLADHGEAGPVVGVAFDGLGFGP